MRKSFSVLVVMIAFISSLKAQGNENEEQILLGAASNFTCKVINCQTCVDGDENTCQICEGGLIWINTQCDCQTHLYKVDNTSCVGCISNCDQCSDHLSCDICFSGFYYDNGTQACTRCSSNCVACTSGTACTTCEGGYVKNADSGECEVLPQGVSGVAQGIDGKIIQCIGGCAKCSDAQSCDKCEDGFYKNGQTCAVCTSPCLTCEGATNADCLSCPNKYLLESGSCNTCQDAKCLDCNPSTKCFQCTQGYGVESGNCVPCEDNCVECSAATNCLGCAGGYILFNGDCVECLTGCGVCNESNYIQCLECNQGFYFNDQTACTLCPTGCSTCSSATSCQSCSSGYQLSGQMCYEACIHPCYKCTNGKPTECTECFSGYLISGNVCNADTSCNGTSSCNSCPRQYYLVNKKCEPCTTENTCSKCDPSSPGTCTQCITGYYVAGGSCTACPSECSSCSSSVVCTGCMDGYFLVKINGQSTGECSPCDANYFCSTCMGSATQCLSCLEGYDLYTSKCVSQNNVNVQMELLITLQSFLSKINDFKVDMTNAMGQPYAGNPHYLTFNEISQGSLILDTTVTVPEGANVDDAAGSVTNTLTGDNVTLGGVELGEAPKIQIVTAPVDPVNPVDPVDPNDGDTEPEPEPESETNLGLVLGLSIPLLLIVLSLILIVKAKSGTPQDELEEDVIESGEDFGEK